MNIGIFKRDGDDFTGNISTFGANFAHVTFEAIRSQGNGPAYIIHSNGGELGAAWKKTSEKGNEYLSVSFKGPFLPGPVYAALVATNEANSFALVWNEPKKD